MTARRTTAFTILTAAVLAMAACGTDDEPNAEETTTTPSPVITAPPTLSEEEQLAADIEDTYRDSVATLDAAYAETATWAEDDNTSALEAARRALLTDQAELDESNSLTVHKFLQVNRTGSSQVVEVEVTDVTAGEDGSASLTACVDLTGIEYTDVAGETVELQSVIDAIDDQYRQTVEDGLLRVDDIDYQRRTVQLHHLMEGEWRVAEYTSVEEVDQC